MGAKRPESVAKCCGKEWNCIQKRLVQFFEIYGKWVARYPWVFLLVPIVVAGILSAGMVYKDTLTGADYLFTPFNSPYKYEEATIREYWANSDDLFYPGKDVLRRKSATVLVTAKDGGSVLRPMQSRQFHELMNFIVNNITTDDEIPINYEKVCLRFHDSCYKNAHAALISDIFINGDQETLAVTYPKYKLEYMADSIYLGDSLGGAVVNESNNELISAKAWMVTYQLKSQDELSRDNSYLWEMAFEKALRNYDIDTNLTVEFTHTDTMEAELRKNADRVVPKYIGCLLLLIFFSVMCTFTFDRHPGRLPAIDWCNSSPYLALGGVMAAAFGVTAGQGLLYFFGVKHQDMVSVLPFLCVSIGVDNMFLVVACWRVSTRELSVEDRMSETLSHAAVSITITSLTDAISFAVGAMTPLPAVQIFCALASAAIMMTFLFQLTFFMAIVVFEGRRQHGQRHCIIPLIKTVPFSESKVGILSYFLRSGGRNSCYKRKPWNKILFEDYYAPLVSNLYVQLMAMILLVLYLTVAIVGMQSMELGFEVEKLLVEDSEALPFFQIRSKYFEDDGYKLEVVVNNPPDLANVNERRHFKQMLHEFEDNYYTKDNTSTEFWLNAYDNYMKELNFDLPSKSKTFLQHLRPFLLMNERYAYDLVFEAPKSSKAKFVVAADPLFDDVSNDELELKAFRFALGLAHVATNDGKIQFMVIWPSTMQNIGIALGAMVLISLMLIPHPLCAIVVAASIISIDIGIFGYMTWWHVNLDCISMITIVMSVGFSVDFAAHITYGYTACETFGCTQPNLPSARLATSLGTLAWPMTQGALSTVIGVLVLSTVESYMVQTFFKTVFLVICIGLLHSLLFLPVILALCHTFYIYINTKFGGDRSVRPVSHPSVNAF